MPETSYLVYCLKDPRDGSVKYVGQTSSRAARENAHRNNYPQGNNEKHAWARELEGQSLTPIFEVLEYAEDYGELNKLETKWVRIMASKGEQLTNRPVGAIRKQDIVSIGKLEEINAKLKAIHDEISTIGIWFLTVFGNKNKEGLRLTGKIKNGIDEVRYAIDDKLYEMKGRLPQGEQQHG